MNANTRKLTDLGQSIWLDNISRDMLQERRLERLVEEFSVTGLTSNPTIFEKSISSGDAYDDSIADLARAGRKPEEAFFSLALEDLREAARLFEPAHERTNGIDGWASLELSPLLIDDTVGSIRAAARLHEEAACRNLFIKIPGTSAGVPAIEESIFQGVPINVTLLFSRGQVVAAAEAYMRGIEGRIARGLDPVVESVASLFVSRWDVAANGQAPESMHNRLGIAEAMRAYKAYRDLLASERWSRLAAAGAHPQRLLWASTGTKDKAASPTLYVEALAAPDTINTMPDKTLEALADQGRIERKMPTDGGDAEAVIEEFRRHGVDDKALADQLQREGGAKFTESWNALMDVICKKMARVTGREPEDEAAHVPH
jgi:transaldolase